MKKLNAGKLNFKRIPVVSVRKIKAPEKFDFTPDSITFIAFIAVLAVFGVLSFAIPKPNVSQIENRPLEKLPGFSIAKLADGSLTDGFSRYYSDTFPWRERMIEISSDFKSLFGIRGEEDVSIHYGIDTAGGQDDAPPAAEGETVPPAAVASGGATAAAASGGAVSGGGIAVPGGAAASGGAIAVSGGATAGTPAVPGAGTGAALGTGSAAAPPQGAQEGTGDENRLTGDGKREGGVIVIGDTGLEFYGFVEKPNKKYADIINKFDDKYRGQITTAALIAPTNIEFKIPDKYKELSDDQRKAISYIYGRLNEDVVKIDVYGSLREHSGEYVYFRTDHHWTQLGAFYAYRDYCKALGLRYTGMLSYSRLRLDGFLGSFYNAIGGDSDMKKNPDYVLAYKPVVPYEATGYFDSAMKQSFNFSLIRTPEEITVSNKYLALSGGDLPVIDIKMQSNTGRRLIIFKESYANAFIPFLTENYDEILVVDFRYYEGNVDNLVKKYKINEALFINYVSSAGSERQVDRLSSMLK
jgi:hypothetical protein